MTMGAPKASSKLRRGSGRRAGFTLIETMIVIALLGILLALAAPSMREMIEVRRLRAINSQLVTDLQYARGEAISRRALARLDFKNTASQSCYTIYTSPGRAIRCDCTLGAGMACAPGSGAIEIRSVVIPKSLGSEVVIPLPQRRSVGFEPAMGSLVAIPIDFDPLPIPQYQIETQIDAARKFRIVLNQSGRPAVCAPAGSRMDAEACP